MPIGEELRNFSLSDGILINQENSHNTWILEAFIPATEREVFDALLQSGEVFNARVVISFPDNDPVPFRLITSTIKDINDHVSVLMKGSLVRKKRQNPTEVLKSLLHENLSEQELLQRFEETIQSKN